jgi:UDP-N-acetylenolpyruvoylglucosamine reductase
VSGPLLAVVIACAFSNTVIGLMLVALLIRVRRLRGQGEPVAFIGDRAVNITVNVTNADLNDPRELADKIAARVNRDLRW